MADATKSTPFLDMAARIDRMGDVEFAGAVVVMPPDGKPITFLLTDPEPSVAQFWSSVISRVEIAAAEAKDAQTHVGGYGMRR